MSTDGVNHSRRRMLIGTTAAVGAVGAAFVATPFVKSWNPSAKAKAAGAPVTADLSKLELGQQMVVEWRGKPVWVVRRSPEALADLKKVAGDLRDPESNESVQPDFAKNEYRAIKPEYAILVGICTHLGCSPTYRPEVAPADLGQSWRGGFFCPCHGSTYDMAGRVYKSVPAPLNLEVPPYKYLSDSVVLIGEA
ncbi:MAG TPA: ubiquinol-cytochrome c reductase iron-sulfur subunit [Agitococcus sp.]|nr:ubiquinol-cytochrome c reductase iron-sulfur subunit [Agitococcus sp.]HMV60078.1 ubiquinol-cytochrome c reductase iron-sulfur subunit [Agitococcus sp.]HNA19885.1 ubiquinol-cytochrome c reductase iron-sulfur subunit [Agitococcus sp.]HNE90408.1 ubiquinol-cytochrome c reductase iron-sulfur subunit [Agitococcus sp.]HNG10344.1 ubiquinol-cytochrome c reductase iron-sulfur subunit [Agitococcus sp.]